MDEDEVVVARVIGVSTLLSGLSLLLAPRLMLRLLGADADRPAPLLFRVVGMFMGVSGGLLAEGAEQPMVVRWSIVQKIGATLGVTLGVLTGQYRPRALGVASFDAVSSILLMRMLRRRDG
jgi:hypothetical protein